MKDNEERSEKREKDRRWLEKVKDRDQGSEKKKKLSAKNRPKIILDRERKSEKKI